MYETRMEGGGLQAIGFPPPGGRRERSSSCGVGNRRYRMCSRLMIQAAVSNDGRTLNLDGLARGFNSYFFVMLPNPGVCVPVLCM